MKTFSEAQIGSTSAISLKNGHPQSISNERNTAQSTIVESSQNYSVDELVRCYNAGTSGFALASQEGIRIPSLFQRFRRAGYRWDLFRGCYSKTPLVGRRSAGYSGLSERAVQAIIQCRGVKADKLSTALRLGFKSVKEMDEYMTKSRYAWDDSLHLYAPMPVFEQGPGGCTSTSQ